MNVIDYYSEPLATKVGYGLGVGARNAQIVAQQVSPVKAAAAVMVAWGSIAGLINYKRYKQGKLTKKEAVAVTANESVGMGLAAGTGLLADTLVKPFFFAAASAPVIPFAVAVAVTGTTKIAWDCITRRNMMWCGRTPNPLSCDDDAAA